MGTAVLSPQDCLSSPPSRPNRQFSRMPYRPASAPRSGMRASTAGYSASASASASASRRGSAGGAIFRDGRGLLGLKNASAGLLPRPDQGLQYARPRPHTPSCGGGRSMAFYGDGPSMASLSPPFRKLVSSAALCPPTVGSPAASRRHSSSVPAGRSASAGLPPQQSFAGRGLLRERQSTMNGRLSPREAQDYGSMGSWASVAGVAPVPTQGKFLPSSKFCDAGDTVPKKSVNGAGYLKKRAYPELCQVESQMIKQGMKLPFKVLLEAHGDTCQVKDQVAKKAGVPRHLERFIPDKLQDSIPVTILQRPKTKEAAEDLIASFFEEMTGCDSPGSADTESPSPEEKCGALPSFGKEKLEMCSLVLSSDTHKKERETICQKSLRVPNSDAVCEGTPEVAAAWKIDSTKKDGGAFCRTNLNHSTDNVAVGRSYLGVNGEHTPILKEDQPVGRLDFLASGVADKYPLQMAGALQRIDMELLIHNDDKAVALKESEEISRCFDSVSEKDRWLSMIDSERWAGPSFFNSPCPSSLPLPSFMMKLSRAFPLEHENIVAQHVNSEHSSKKSSPIFFSVGAMPFPEVKGSWDAAFATKDLKRMLNLQPCSL